MIKAPPRMLVADALFPPTRRKVLRLFFANPERRFTLQEVVQRVGIGAGAVRSELNRLLSAGILALAQDTYQVVQSAPAYGHLSGLMMRTDGVQEVLESVLQPLADRIPVAFIFGTFARDDVPVASDVDVFIVGEIQVEDLARALEPAHEILEREIHPSIVTLERFRWNLQTGDPFLRRVIDGPKIFLVGDQEGLVELGR